MMELALSLQENVWPVLCKTMINSQHLIAWVLWSIREVWNSFSAFLSGNSTSFGNMQCIILLPWNLLRFGFPRILRPLGLQSLLQDHSFTTKDSLFALENLKNSHAMYRFVKYRVLLNKMFAVLCMSGLEVDDWHSFG